MEGQNYIKEKDIEGSPNPISFEKMENILEQIKKCICDIKCTVQGHGTGFFCKIPYPDVFNIMPALITNNHVLSKEDIAEGNIIKFTLDKGTIQKEILITNERKIYSNENYDVTIIQLNPLEDSIEPNSFLDVESKIINCEDPNKVFKNKEVYIIGNIKEYTYGRIKRIHEDGITIEYSFSTKPGMSGSPIINLDNYKIVGIHKGSHSTKKYNLGTFLMEPFKQFYLLTNKTIKMKNQNQKQKKIMFEEKIKISNEELVDKKNEEKIKVSNENLIDKKNKEKNQNSLKKENKKSDKNYNNLMNSQNETKIKPNENLKSEKTDFKDNIEGIKLFCKIKDSTDLTKQITRRYNDFYSLYEKLIERWPGIYIPRIPKNNLTGTQDTSIVKTRIRLLNRFCIQLSKIEYLYNSEEINTFKNNASNAINKLSKLSYSEMLNRMKIALPVFNENCDLILDNYDVLAGKNKISQFEQFLKKTKKQIEEFQNSVIIGIEVKEKEIKKYLEMLNNFANYERDILMPFADYNNEDNLIFFNPRFISLSEKVSKLKDQMINPFIVLKNFLEEEILDIEAMEIAINQLFHFNDDFIKLNEKLKKKKNFFKGLFKKNNIDEKEITELEIEKLQKLIKIVGFYLENQIEMFKNEKAQNYYKYLKKFGICQKESNKVIRELWSLVKNAIKDISPNLNLDDYPIKLCWENEYEEEY